MPFVVCLGVLSHLNLEVFPHPQGSMNFNQRYCSTILLSKNILYTQSFIHIYKGMQLWIFLYTYVKEKRLPWELQMATFVPDLLDSAGPFASSIFEERCHFFGKTGQVDVAIWSELCGDLSRNVAIWRILKNPHVSHFKIKSTIHDFQNLRKLESRIPRKKHCHLDMHFLIPTLKILKPKFRGKDIAICNFWFQHLRILKPRIPRKKDYHL